MRICSCVVLSFALASSSISAAAGVPAELLAHVTSARSAQSLQAGSVVQRGSANETELTWTTQGESARAWLLVPTAQRKAPLVVFLHGESAVPQPRMFIDEGVSLAAGNVASLHVSLPLAKAATPGADDAAAIAASVERVQDVITWARTQANLNGERIALVGHRYGAMVATIVAALDPKIDALALLAPPGKPSGWLQVSDRSAAERLRSSYDKQTWGPYLFGLAKFDTELWLPHARHARAFFQFAAQDDWTTTLEQVELFRAAKGAKERHSYESDSALNAEARATRLAWLKKVMQ